MTLRQSRFDIRQTGMQILIVFGVVAALNLGFYLLYVKPAVEEYRTLRDDSRPGFDALREREEEVEHRERYLAGLKQAESDLQRLRDEILSTREARMVEVDAELSRLAEDFNIDLDSVTYGNEVLVDEGLDRLSMTVPLEGGYANLRNFLQAVEDSDKFLLVERVALAKGKRGGVMLSLNIGLATYFNAPAIADAAPEGRARDRRGRS